MGRSQHFAEQSWKKLQMIKRKNSSQKQPDSKKHNNMLISLGKEVRRAIRTRDTCTHRNVFLVGDE